MVEYIPEKLIVQAILFSKGCDVNCWGSLQSGQILISVDTGHEAFPLEQGCYSLFWI